jgi:hypothetical protein
MSAVPQAASADMDRPTSAPPGALPDGSAKSAVYPSLDWAQEAAAEAEAEESGQTNPWGNDDLMDVNADQDDWSASSAYIHAGKENTNGHFRRIRNCTCCCNNCKHAKLTFAVGRHISAATDGYVLRVIEKSPAINEVHM